MRSKSMPSPAGTALAKATDQDVAAMVLDYVQQCVRQTSRPAVERP